MNTARLVTFLVSGCTAAAVLVVGTLGLGARAQAAPNSRAVVIVSGGAAISPFTTPDAACQTGSKGGTTWYAAGSTDSFMRSYLLRKGHQVFTSPAMAGRGKVTEQPGAGGPFHKCPKALPAYMTVNSDGDIELAGVHLANFVNHLNDAYGITEVDFVAHSMGGLYSRSAIAYLQALKSPVQVTSLTTMGTPWDGAIFADSPDPENPKAACDGFALCESLLDVFATTAPVVLTEDSARQSVALNAANVGVLKSIPVTMIAGNAFKKPQSTSHIWPNDGIVAAPAALGAQTSDRAINHRRCYLYEGGTHSVYISKAAGMPDGTAITWNTTVGSWVDGAIRASGTAMAAENRIGCPTS